ncbi:MAG: Pr6Pr family membrane protein [Gemmatimonadota bacterium]
MVDVLLHDVMPVLFLVYWWLIVPKRGLPWTRVSIWALYPLGYFLYALGRGAVSGLYPYPFIDVGALGYGPVLLNATWVLVGFVILAMLLIAVGCIKDPASAHAAPAR